MRDRIRTAVERPGRKIEAYDEGQMAIDHGYARTDIFQQAGLFGDERQKTAEYVGSLTEEDLGKAVTHPERGQMIVFKNPQFNASSGDDYIVKRVIAFPGERVTVHDGTLTVYNSEHPNGFQPDKGWDGPGSPTSGDVNTTVSEGTLFVAGDHRQGNYSYDSRSGLGLIPFYDVVGPVGLRIYPFNKIQAY